MLKNKTRKRLISVVLCLVFLLIFVAGCAKPKEAVNTSDAVRSDACVSSDTAASSETADVTPSETTEPEEELFVFNPKVRTVFMDEAYPAEMTEAWFNLIDAVYAGEDTFACSDQNTYDWMFGQFPKRFFPVFEQIVGSNYAGAVKDGTATFSYKVSKKKAKKMLDDFEVLVTDIINTAMKPSNTEFENALSLYVYFVDHYEYDYDTYYKMYDTPVEYLSAYRLLTTGIGICSEIAPAYSYLLMQAGIEANTVMGPEHEWSYVLLNGHYYHIDVTFALGATPAELRYFLMTDKQREETGFEPKDYVFTSNYTLEFGGPVYVADDDTFAELWEYYFDHLDRDTHTLYCIHATDDGETESVTFDYEGY